MCLCDDGNNDEPFLRQIIRTGPTSTTVNDTELDGETPYVVLGNAIKCPAGGGGGGAASESTDTVVLCDDGTNPNTPYLLRFESDGAGVVTPVTINVDGITPYVLAGNPTVCLPVIPDESCQCDDVEKEYRTYGVGGGDGAAFAFPNDTYSVTFIARDVGARTGADGITISINAVNRVFRGNAGDILTWGVEDCRQFLGGAGNITAAGGTAAFDIIRTYCNIGGGA